ncbi:hypothetical protein A3D78_01475 [Candidatus Gottesmanbacteria bacterium RIFCSPHIGHO2_02_FULL_39_14]|uniref:O-antigen ligase-related domain-containing protein n=1 Tax=Candidatus Gottesmanbacteria bacterium RIFCSPHIGHO2_02_FULL_39_14 TaxID=1798383 RepID=A0A1F5ZWA1_9BACT|nr:MAG: hypothetical protein A3D78_01475 [Candidatus Gottesmanbacteria bacterium RIFCSPHIGHO2_02_FULL_39_14]
MLHWGLILLFFLPVIESFSREVALLFLFLGALVASYPVFWKRKIAFNSDEILFLIFIFFGIVSTIFSISTYRSLTELSRYLAYFLIFISIRNDQIIGNRFRKFFSGSILVNSLVLSILFFAYFLFSSYLPKVTSGMNLFYPVFGYNRIANLLIIAIPLLISQRRLWLLAFFSLVLIGSVSRGSLLALSIGLVISLVIPLFRKSIFYKASIFYFVITMVILTSVFISSHFILTKREGNLLYSGLYKPVTNEKRVEYFRQAIYGFTDTPLIGSGLDTFRYISQRLQKSPANWTWYVHNHFLQLFSDTGFLGGSVFILLIVLLMLNAYEEVKSNRNNLNRGIFLALIVSIIHSLIDFDWQFISIFLYIFIGFALLSSKYESKKQINIKPLYILAIVLFITTFILGREYRAIENAAIIDGANSDINRKLGEEYRQEKKYQQAHIYFQKAILHNPLDLGEIIKGDYLLYLKEAELALQNNDYDGAWQKLNYLLKVYPLFHKKYGSGLLRRDNLLSYIRYMSKAVGDNPLRIWEIKEITGYLAINYPLTRKIHLLF